MLGNSGSTSAMIVLITNIVLRMCFVSFCLLVMFMLISWFLCFIGLVIGRLV